MRVFVNGCFDVLHIGHIRLFEFAKSKGDTLMVAIDSDSRVRESKGLERPYNSQEDRAEMLMSIKYIDSVVIFENDDELKSIIKKVSPDLMIVGSDWKGKTIVGGEYAKKIHYFERVGEYSTTRILENSSRR